MLVGDQAKMVHVGTNKVMEATRNYRSSEAEMISKETTIEAAPDRCRGSCPCDWRTMFSIRPKGSQEVALV
ncbi:hypothetical protein ACLOJK_028538 [Asimina triloba]